MDCNSCQIKNRIYAYAGFIDSGDFDAVAELFRAGRILARVGDGSTAAIEGADAVRGLYQAFTRLYEDDGTPHTLHLTSNVVVSLQNEDAATASSTAVVFQATEALPLQAIIGVRYYDKFQNIAGSWEFLERRIETRLSGDLSQHLLRPV